MDESFHDLLEESPSLFLSNTFRNTLSECLPFDKFLRRGLRTNERHKLGGQTIWMYKVTWEPLGRTFCWGVKLPTVSALGVLIGSTPR